MNKLVRLCRALSLENVHLLNEYSYFQSKHISYKKIENLLI